VSSRRCGVGVLVRSEYVLMSRILFRLFFLRLLSEDTI
jgi:hypothetical protein